MLEKYIESKRKRFIINRTIRVIPVLILATLVAFLMMRAGGLDLARINTSPAAGEEAIQQFRERHDLHLPLYRQYYNWFTGLFHGEMGTSLTFEEPVAGLIMDRLPVTFQLMGLSLLISLTIGISMGVLGALKHNTWIDYVATVQSLFWRSIPSFWAATIFQLYIAYELGLFPIMGYTGGIGGLYYLFLPALILGLRLQAIIARLTRSSMLSVMNRDYIKSAKTKGLTKNTVIFKHGLRNALIPVVTVVAMRLPWLIGGAMVTEQIFNIPGMGRLILSGTLNRDFILVQSSVLLITIIAVLANLAADIGYTFVDPRIDIGKEEEV